MRIIGDHGPLRAILAILRVQTARPAPETGTGTDKLISDNTQLLTRAGSRAVSKEIGQEKSDILNVELSAFISVGFICTG